MYTTDSNFRFKERGPQYNILKCVFAGVRPAYLVYFGTQCWDFVTVQFYILVLSHDQVLTMLLALLFASLRQNVA